jgi:hypothetical protein
VTSANHWGKPYVGGSDKSIAVSSDTKVRGQGMKQLSELKSGFRVLIQARVCKADLSNGATPALTATKVIAHDPRKADKDENDNQAKDNGQGRRRLIELPWGDARQGTRVARRCGCRATRFRCRAARRGAARRRSAG